MDPRNGNPLPREKECATVLRSIRWDGSVYCLYCGSASVVKNGLRPDHVQKYLCNSCNSSFNDRTRTVFEGTGMSLPECFHALKSYQDGRSINEISRDLERDWETVNNFIRETEHLLTPSTFVERLSGDTGDITRAIESFSDDSEYQEYRYDKRGC